MSKINLLALFALGLFGFFASESKANCLLDGQAYLSSYRVKMLSHELVGLTANNYNKAVSTTLSEACDEAIESSWYDLIEVSQSTVNDKLENEPSINSGDHGITPEDTDLYVVLSLNTSYTF